MQSTLPVAQILPIATAVAANFFSITESRRAGLTHGTHAHRTGQGNLSRQFSDAQEKKGDRPRPGSCPAPHQTHARVSLSAEIGSGFRQPADCRAGSNASRARPSSRNTDCGVESIRRRESTAPDSTSAGEAGNCSPCSARHVMHMTRKNWESKRPATIAADHLRHGGRLAPGSGGRDSNPRQPAWEAGTLPTELPPHEAPSVYDPECRRSTSP